jgi:hypothetical protein
MSIDSKTSSLDGLSSNMAGMHTASLHLLVPASVVAILRDYFALNIADSDASKSRFVESCLFAATVLGVIAVAAVRIV